MFFFLALSTRRRLPMIARTTCSLHFSLQNNMLCSSPSKILKCKSLRMTKKFILTVWSLAWAFKIHFLISTATFSFSFLYCAVALLRQQLPCERIGQKIYAVPINYSEIFPDQKMLYLWEVPRVPDIHYGGHSCQTSKVFFTSKSPT